ncbi:MAG: hypothetical protein IKI54_01235 [Lachnospiraceae bacterium]|nr:hypothetical protein [Lachnospiraceae bacterium]
MIKRLLKSLREFKKTAWLTMLVMIGEVVMEVLIPYKMADLIDIGFANGDLPYIVKTGIILINRVLNALGFIGEIVQYLTVRKGFFDHVVDHVAC